MSVARLRLATFFQRASKTSGFPAPLHAHGLDVSP